jgi:ferredoxin
MNPPERHWLTVLPEGVRVPVEPGQSLLEAALAAGVELPRSCRNGTCRACRCQLSHGRVRYRVAWPGLSPDERDAGEVLPCVALPECDVSINQPLARRAGGGTSAGGHR